MPKYDVEINTVTVTDAEMKAAFPNWDALPPIEKWEARHNQGWNHVRSLRRVRIEPRSLGHDLWVSDGTVAHYGYSIFQASVVLEESREVTQEDRETEERIRAEVFQKYKLDPKELTPLSNRELSQQRAEKNRQELQRNELVTAIGSDWVERHEEVISFFDDLHTGKRKKPEHRTPTIPPGFTEDAREFLRSMIGRASHGAVDGDSAWYYYMPGHIKGVLSRVVEIFWNFGPSLGIDAKSFLETTPFTHLKLTKAPIQNSADEDFPLSGWSTMVEQFVEELLPDTARFFHEHLDQVDDLRKFADQVLAIVAPVT